MREHKYKAYLKAENRVFDVGMIDFLYENVYEFISHGESSCDEVKHYPFTEVELMEFTGLKDWKGKEIFEGDIIQERKSIGQIVYMEDSFNIEWFTNPEFFNDILKYHHRNSRVLGNIYSNPELLPKEKEVSNVN